MVDKRVRYEPRAAHLATYLSYNTAPKGTRLACTPSLCVHLITQKKVQCEEVLLEASVRLMEIVMLHSRRMVTELQDAERLERSQSNLSELERIELKKYESPENRIITAEATKI